MLCLSKFTSQKKTFKAVKCGKNGSYWDSLMESEKFVFINFNKAFKKKYFSLQKHELIHVVICTRCFEEYIGWQLKHRLCIYKQHKAVRISAFGSGRATPRWQKK